MYEFGTGGIMRKVFFAGLICVMVVLTGFAESPIVSKTIGDFNVSVLSLKISTGSMEMGEMTYWADKGFAFLKVNLSITNNSGAVVAIDRTKCYVTGDGDSEGDGFASDTAKVQRLSPGKASQITLVFYVADDMEPELLTIDNIGEIPLVKN
jgi:hypothetical protein